MLLGTPGGIGFGGLRPRQKEDCGGTVGDGCAGRFIGESGVDGGLGVSWGVSGVKQGGWAVVAGGGLRGQQ